MTSHQDRRAARAGRSWLIAVIAVAVATAGFMASWQPRPAVAQSALTIHADEAEPNFPEGIQFTLDVEAPRAIVNVELLYHVADLETLRLAAPPFNEGERIDLSYLLDFRLAYQPSGVDVTYRWRLTDDRGDIHETEPRTLLWSDNRFDWQSFASEDVTVYAYNQNEAFNQIILDSAQGTVDRLQEEFGLTAIEPIRIWVYNSQPDFAATQQGNSSHWIAGTAYPQLHVILAILPEGNKREVGRVIPHEISHQVLNQAADNPFNAPPTWLDEGIAVMNQDGGNEDFLAMVEDAAEKGRLFSARALNSSFPFDPADATLAYAESYAIVQFIIERFGEEKLAATIDAYRDGVSHDEALLTGLGVDIDELDRLWKESLNYAGDQPRAAGPVVERPGWQDPSSLGSTLAGMAVLLALLGAMILLAARSLRGRATDRVASQHPSHDISI